MSSGKEQQCIRTTKNQAAEERSQDTRRFVRQARSATRRKHTAEEKAQVLEKVEASPGSKGKVRIIIESKDNVKPEYFEITGEIVQITG
mgnify:CR=1 FL=1